MKILPLVILLVLAAASYRVTRFIVLDDLIAKPRDKFHDWLLSGTKHAFVKVYELFTCTWCAGVWVSAVIYWLYLQDFEFSVETFINVAAIAGIQGLLHAFEPEEE